MQQSELPPPHVRSRSRKPWRWLRRADRVPSPVAAAGATAVRVAAQLGLPRRASALPERGAAEGRAAAAGARDPEAAAGERCERRHAAVAALGLPSACTRRKTLACWAPLTSRLLSLPPSHMQELEAELQQREGEIEHLEACHKRVCLSQLAFTLLMQAVVGTLISPVAPGTPVQACAAARRAELGVGATCWGSTGGCCLTSPSSSPPLPEPLPPPALPAGHMRHRAGTCGCGWHGGVRGMALALAPTPIWRQTGGRGRGGGGGR